VPLGCFVTTWNSLPSATTRVVESVDIGNPSDVQVVDSNFPPAKLSPSRLAGSPGKSSVTSYECPSRLDTDEALVVVGVVEGGVAAEEPPHAMVNRNAKAQKPDRDAMMSPLVISSAVSIRA
jgi:hypothetical protein